MTKYRTDFEHCILSPELIYNGKEYVTLENAIKATSELIFWGWGEQEKLIALEEKMKTGVE